MTSPPTSDDTSSDEGLKAPMAERAGSRVTLDGQQMNTAQKLLLFWRKPAVSPHALAIPPLSRLRADARFCS